MSGVTPGMEALEEEMRRKREKIKVLERAVAEGEATVKSIRKESVEKERAQQEENKLLSFDLEVMKAENEVLNRVRRSEESRKATGVSPAGLSPEMAEIGLEPNFYQDKWRAAERERDAKQEELDKCRTELEQKRAELENLKAERSAERKRERIGAIQGRVQTFLDQAPFTNSDEEKETLRRQLNDKSELVLQLQQQKSELVLQHQKQLQAKDAEILENSRKHTEENRNLLPTFLSIVQSPPGPNAPQTVGSPSKTVVPDAASRADGTASEPTASEESVLLKRELLSTREQLAVVQDMVQVLREGQTGPEYGHESSKMTSLRTQIAELSDETKSLKRKLGKERRLTEDREGEAVAGDRTAATFVKMKRLSVKALKSAKEERSRSQALVQQVNNDLMPSIEKFHKRFDPSVSNS